MMGNSPVKLKDDKNLLLVGRAGHGKSSTGNTILNVKAFFTGDSGTAVTMNATLGKAKYDDHTLTVIDTPGIADLRETDKAIQRERVVRSILDVFFECPNGFHAVLLVLRYNGRYTGEDKEAVNLLKDVFGSAIFGTHGIVIITRGEEFIQNYDKDEITFLNWVRDQHGHLRELIEECKDRVILFCNSNPSRHKWCRNRLFEYLNSIKDVYTKDKLQQTH